MWAEPLGCMGSVSTRPLNDVPFDGRRTTRRVLYGWPFAVPEMMYSCASYLYAARPWPCASDWTDSYPAPGPVTSSVTVGRTTAVGVCGRLIVTAGPRPPPCPRPCAAADPCRQAGTDNSAIAARLTALFIVLLPQSHHRADGQQVTPFTPFAMA